MTKLRIANDERRIFIGRRGRWNDCSQCSSSGLCCFLLGTTLLLLSLKVLFESRVDSIDTTYNERSKERKRASERERHTSQYHALVFKGGMQTSRSYVSIGNAKCSGSGIKLELRREICRYLNDAGGVAASSSSPLAGCWTSSSVKICSK